MILSPIDEIKNRLDIIEVISSYIKLQKAGANFRAICPFHSEKKPSLFVSPAKQIWHCFGCSKGGSIFNFIMEIEGVEFGDALRILAKRAGVELKREDPKLKTERQRLYEICQLACQFFERQLDGIKVGKEVKKYLLKRRINEQSIRKWRLGYAPDTWQGLSDFLVGKGYKREEIIKTGLAVKSEKDQTPYDRFRGRIIFPIFDLNSQIIGFGGRIFGEKAKDEIAKYVNTPNTILYDKSRVLYGLDKAKLEIRKRGSCILVEGYTDTIMAHQAGFENVIATSGTALTPYQLRILKRYTENLLTAFDMDIAGDTATKRGIDLAQTQGFDIRVIIMPEGSDPCDIISKSLKDWEKLVNETKSILDFYFETTFSRFDSKTPEGKREISKILLPPIKRIPNKILQAHWIQSLAKKLEVGEEDIAEELKKIKLETSEVFPTKVPLPSLPKPRKQLLEERLVSLVFQFPDTFDLITKKDFDFFSPNISQILNWFKKAGLRIDKFPKDFPPESENLINHLSLRAEIEQPNQDVKEIKEEFKDCLKEIERLEIKGKLDKISKEVRIAEEEKDSKKCEKLIREFNLCSKSLRDLEQT